MKRIALTVAIALAAVGCRRGDTALRQYDTNAVLRISVFKSGEIRADGGAVSLQDLDSLIASNAQKKGVVWYYREAGQENPSPQAMEVIQLVVKHRRPIRMWSRADFSDAIGRNGKPVPPGRESTR